MATLETVEGKPSGLPPGAITDGLVVEMVDPNGGIGTVPVARANEALASGYHFATMDEHLAANAREAANERDELMTKVGLVGGGVAAVVVVVLVLRRTRSPMARTLAGMAASLAAFAAGGGVPALIVGVGALLWVAHGWRAPPAAPPASSTRTPLEQLVADKIARAKKTE